MRQFKAVISLYFQSITTIAIYVNWNILLNVIFVLLVVLKNNADGRKKKIICLSSLKTWGGRSGLEVRNVLKRENLYKRSSLDDSLKGLE
jgi:hypothetical protein